MPTKHVSRKPKRAAKSTASRKQKSRKSSGPLLASSKLSDYHILRVIRLFAEGVSPAEAARQIRISYVTIQRIYDLVRRRLCLLGYYLPFDEFIDLMDGREDVVGYWDKRHFLTYMNRKLRERKGVTQATLPFHMAELSYRYVQEEFEEPGTTPTNFAEMVQLLRVSGPINRPPDLDRILQALEFGLGRIQDNHRSLNREIRVKLSRL